MEIEGVIKNNLTMQNANINKPVTESDYTVQDVSGKGEASVTITEAAKNNQSEKQNKEAIKKAVEQINKKMSHTECRYGIHEATNRVMIKIVDKETDKVIKEFPPEETLDIIAKAWELAGIMVDEKR